MKPFSAILLTILVMFTAFTASAEEFELELKGIQMTSEPKEIRSPWGLLKNSMLLLNNPQRLSMSGNDLNIIFGIFYFDEKSATPFDGKLKISDSWTASKKLKVKMFQDENTGKWCATDGFVATTSNDTLVFNGLEISVIGGKEKPLIINGEPFSDCTVEIKNGRVSLLSKKEL
jgi:hypothetical protein